MTTLNVVPMAKPRMTRQDKWMKRPAVLRYRAFCEELQLKAARAKLVLPHGGASITFHIPMPDSWSQRKKTNMVGTPHQTKPDLDNLCKAVFDAMFEDDAPIYSVSLHKRWATAGAITFETPRLPGE